MEKVDESTFKVWVKEPAKEGKANAAAACALAEHFNVPKSSVKLILGRKSKKKIFKVFF